MKERARQTLENLRTMIGSSVKFENNDYKLIELLEDELAIVLEACHKYTDIQPDQMGEAHRRVPRTVTIPVLMGENKDEFNTAFLSLDLPITHANIAADSNS